MLRVGYGKTEIIPPLGAFMNGYYVKRYVSGVHDPIYTIAVALEKDGKRSAIVVADICNFRNDKEFDKWRSEMAEKCGMETEALFICATHTHTAPMLFGDPADPTYAATFTEKTEQAIKAAFDDLAPAQIRTASSTLKGNGFIRRYKMKDGSVATNPGFLNPDIVDPVGTPDEELRVIRFIRENADEVVIVNFANHPDNFGGSEVSADYPGVVRDIVEKALGVKCMYMNGAQGDVNNFNYKGPMLYGKYKTWERVCNAGREMAGEAIKIYTNAVPVDEGDITYGITRFAVPTSRVTDPKTLEDADKILKAHNAGDMEFFRPLGLTEKNMAYTTVVAEATRMNNLRNGPDFNELFVSAIKIGDLAFVGISGEPFAAIGKAIKKASPVGNTLVCCDTNGSIGYFPSAEAYAEGGYEARSSPFKPGVGEVIIDKALELLNDIK